MVQHRGLVNLKYALTERYQLGQGAIPEVMLWFVQLATSCLC